MNKLLFIKGLILFTIVTTIFASCTSDNEEELFPIIIEPDDPVVSYSTDVLPIITLNCAVTGCHVTGSISPNLSDKSTFFSKVDRVKARVLAESMPPSSKPDLSIEEIQTIQDWINQGAKDN